MIEISVNKLKKSFGFGNIFNDLTFEIKTGEKVGLVGSNGSGKSTLLKLINNEYSYDDGNISIRNNTTIGYLNQNIINELDDTVVKDILYKNVNNILNIENKLREYETIMEKLSGDKLEKIILKYCNLQEELDRLDGYEVREKIERIIIEFKLEKLLNNKFNTLSGGEKRIVTLASIMINNPDILLLDEPTNHLDIKTLEWLQKYLNNYKGTILIVSHDRYFLDQVTNKTILIENKKAEVFYGNYSYFKEENEKRILLEYEYFKNQQKQINIMKKQIKQLREWGKIGDNERFFKRANSIEKKLEKIELLENPTHNKNIPVKFNIDNRTGNEVIKLINYSLTINNIELIKNSNLIINYQDRICLIGDNGSGKSSLIKDIIKTYNNKKDKDSIIIGSNVLIGYIPQEIEFENSNLTILDYARKSFNKEESNLRSALAKFNFCSDSVFKRVNNISGGEKIRLKLFELIQKKANLIILDEPTNHIDIETKEVLETALLDYKGTLLFISHDRYFINELATKIVSIENNKLLIYKGNYEDYKEFSQ